MSSVKKSVCFHKRAVVYISRGGGLACEHFPLSIMPWLRDGKPLEDQRALIIDLSRKGTVREKGYCACVEP